MCKQPARLLFALRRAAGLNESAIWRRKRPKSGRHGQQVGRVDQVIERPARMVLTTHCPELSHFEYARWHLGIGTANTTLGLNTPQRMAACSTTGLAQCKNAGGLSSKACSQRTNQGSAR